MKQRYVKLDELPFDFERRRISVLVDNLLQNENRLICKGAVDEMLDIATHLREDNTVVALDESRRQTLLPRTHHYNAQAFRALLVSTRQLTDTVLTTTLCAADKLGLAIEGMLTFLNPLKESAAKAIHALQDKGVAIKVLTGDSPIVPARICAVVESTAQTIPMGGK